MLSVTVVSLYNEKGYDNYCIWQGASVTQIVQLLCYELSGQGSIPSRAVIFFVAIATRSAWDSTSLVSNGLGGRGSIRGSEAVRLDHSPPFSAGDRSARS
jgi:hypothetical protein